MTVRHMYICGKIIHWQMRNLSATASWQNTLVCPFEQGDKSSFYLSEEILSTNEYSRTVKASDRATMLNLMVGLNGYTLCSGIICEELNGSDYLAIPFEGDEQNQNSDMEIGYITRKNSILSKVGESVCLFIEEIPGAEYCFCGVI